MSKELFIAAHEELIERYLESREEADRIIDGVLNNATALTLFEGEDDELKSEGPFSFERTIINAVRGA